MKKFSLLAFFLLFLPLKAHDHHALTLRWPLKYGPEMQAFDYVNPNAPQGGTFKIAVVGTFDHLLPFSAKGKMGEGDFLVYESLLKRSLDEPFAMYGRLAESIQKSKDGLTLTFKLRSHAFLTATDVAATFAFVLKQGRYDLRQVLQCVSGVEALSDNVVRVKLKAGTSPQKALMIGFMPIFSKADLSARPKLFMKSAGPYVVAQMIPGKRIVFKKNKDYWGANLAINKGFHNFDTIIYEYFKDRTIALEALKAKQVDMFEEPDVMRLEKEYGQVSKDFDIKAFPKKRPLSAFGFVFNTRRPVFQNIFVRQALAHAFDFEAWNKTYYDGKLKRVSGYFMGSDYAAPHLEDEPSKRRADLHQCFNLLGLAGYKVDHHRLYHHVTQKPLAFELLLSTPADHKLALYYQSNLEKLGIAMTIRTVDPVEYERRRTRFDYDMILNTFDAAGEPGDELFKYWGLEAASTMGSYNYPGVSSAEIDALIGRITQTLDLQHYKVLLQNLDGLLKKGYYMVPLYVYDKTAVVLRKTIGVPDVQPAYYFAAMRWWAPLTWWEKK